MPVDRQDRSTPLGKPKKMPNGWLRVDAHLSRTGVFVYHEPDGSKRRELRLPEEVFNPDSLESFAGVPVTDSHPDVGHLDAENTAEYAKGSVSSEVKQDGHLMRSSLLITDADLIKKLLDGEKREVSNGYTCELDFKPGVWTDEKGTKHAYDAVQRHIRGNHVAVVEMGRAGPEARVRIDARGISVVRNEASDGKQPAAKPPTQEHTLTTIRIDGIDYRVDADGVAIAQALQRQEQKAVADRTDAATKLDAAAKSLADEKARADKLQATVDAKEDELKKKDAEIAALPAKLMVQMKARLDLEDDARAVLGADVKMDGVSDEKLRAQVLAVLAPKAKLDGKSEAYVQGLFDAKMDAFDADGEGIAQVRVALDGEEHDDVDPDAAEEDMEEEEAAKKKKANPFAKKGDSEDARERMIRANRGESEPKRKNASA